MPIEKTVWKKIPSFSPCNGYLNIDFLRRWEIFVESAYTDGFLAKYDHNKIYHGYYVYIIFNEYGLYYIGASMDLNTRISTHVREKKLREFDFYHVYLIDFKKDEKTCFKAEKYFIEQLYPLANRQYRHDLRMPIRSWTVGKGNSVQYMDCVEQYNELAKSAGCRTKQLKKTYICP